MHQCFSVMWMYDDLTDRSKRFISSCMDLEVLTFSTSHTASCNWFDILAVLSKPAHKLIYTPPKKTHNNNKQTNKQKKPKQTNKPALIFVYISTIHLELFKKERKTRKKLEIVTVYERYIYCILRIWSVYSGLKELNTSFTIPKSM